MDKIKYLFIVLVFLKPITGQFRKSIPPRIARVLLRLFLSVGVVFAKKEHLRVSRFLCVGPAHDDDHPLSYDNAFYSDKIV